MMDNSAASKSHNGIPCQSWVGPNGWSTASSQGHLLNPLGTSQHLSLASSAQHRSTYDHLHPDLSGQNTLNDPSTVPSTNRTHHSVMYKASHINRDSPSSALFSNAAISSVSSLVSFAQESPHAPSVLLTANHDPYKESFRPPISSQGLPGGLQHLPISLPSCQQHANMSQATLEGANVVSAEYTHSYGQSTSQEQPLWIPSSHCRGDVNKSFPDTSFHPNNEPSQKNTSALSINERRSELLRQRAQLLQQLAEMDKLLESLPAIPQNDISNGQSLHRDNQSKLTASSACSSPAVHESYDENSPTQDLTSTVASEALKSMPAIHQDDVTDGQSVHTDNQSKLTPSSACSSPAIHKACGEHSPMTEDLTSTQASEELDSMPAIHQDDITDGRSLHTDSQSKRTPSSACSSPAVYEAYDEHSPTTEDLTSTGASEKNENTSAESEDDDSDYLPFSDDDVSEFQSDSDWSFSDESIHSASSTLVDKGSTKRKKRDTSPQSSKRTKNLSPASQEMLTDAVVLPASGKKTHRVYDKRNYCLFCSKPQSKMARHFERIHKDQPEVAVAFQYPIYSKERRKIWGKLTNQGNFLHNKNVLRTGKGLLIVRKRPRKPGRAKDFLHCFYCHGLYLKKALYRHMRICPEKVKNENESEIGRKRIASRCALEVFEKLSISDGFRTVLCEMIYDDVTQAVLNDNILMQFGEEMYNHCGADVGKHHYIRQNLRQIARLVLEAQKTTPLKKLEDFFYPSAFGHVVSAVKVVAGFDPQNKTFTIPSLAVKLGYHLQKACSIVKKKALQSGDATLAESAQNFLSVYQKKWNRLISCGALSTLREAKVTTDRNLPFAQDVKLLISHLENVHLLAEENLRDSVTPENYAALAKVTLARTIIFNRRKPSEVSTIQLTTFMSRKKSDVVDDMDISVSHLEITMCGFFTRVNIRGNCGRMVPVFLKPSVLSAMEFLAKVREKCGVPRNNPFLFGRPCALSAYKGSECIRLLVKGCGVKNPEALTARKIQKHFASLALVMNLDEDEANQIFGPGHKAHILHQNNSFPLDGADGESEVRLQPEGGQHVDSRHHTELSGAIYEQDFFYNSEHGQSAGTGKIVPPTSLNSDDIGFAPKGKQKWEEAEVRAVERHMMRFIQGHKVPQKKDCVQCLEAEPAALRTRSWKGVKDYVRNRITALKRQNGTVPSNSRRQTEPQ